MREHSERREAARSRAPSIWRSSRGGRSHAACWLTCQVTPCSRAFNGSLVPSEQGSKSVAQRTTHCLLLQSHVLRPLTCILPSNRKNHLVKFHTPRLSPGLLPRSALLWAKANSNSCSSKAFSDLPGRLCNPTSGFLWPSQHATLSLSFWEPPGGGGWSTSASWAWHI